MAGCRALTESEVGLILGHLGSTRDKCLFLTGLRTGLRISELLSLRIKDVYRDGKIVDELYITRSRLKGGNGEKKHSISGRSIPLHHQAQHEISNLIQPLILTGKDDPESYLFTTAQGQMSRFMAHLVLKEAYRKSELTGRLATHSMRKTFAGKVYKALEHDLLATRDALGHSDVRNTQRYIAVNTDLVKKAILKD